MCLSCLAETVILGEVLTGIYLVQATKDGGIEFVTGDYGLVFCNGPSFTFKEKPIPDPTPEGLSSEQEDA